MRNKRETYTTELNVFVHSNPVRRATGFPFISRVYLCCEQSVAVNGGAITKSNGEGFISTLSLLFFSITQLKEEEEEIYTIAAVESLFAVFTYTADTRNTVRLFFFNSPRRSCEHDTETGRTTRGEEKFHPNEVLKMSQEMTAALFIRDARKDRVDDATNKERERRVFFHFD